MVRETRHLWVGNLPDNIREEKVKEQFKRYGRVENVKILTKRDSDGSPTALVDFLDINAATKAHDAVIKLGDRDLRIEYNNPDRSPNSLIPDESTAARHRDYESRHARYERRSEGTTDGRFDSAYEGRTFDRERIYNNNRTVTNVADDDTDSTTSGSFRNRRTYNNFYSHSRTEGNYEGNYYSGNREQYAPGYVRSERTENYDSSTRKSKNLSKLRTNKSKSGSSHSGSVSRSQSFSPSRSRSRSRSNSSDSRSSTSDNRSRRSKSSDKGSLNTDHTSCSGVNKQFGLCVKNLPTRSTDTSIKDGLFHEFKKFGQVTAVTVQGSADDRFGIVFFKRSEDMEKAMQTSKGKLFFGSEMRLNAWDGPDVGVDESDIRYYEKEMDEYHPRATRTLFIGNLDRTVSRDELAEAFQKYGDILEIEIKKPHGAQPFAFLQFSDIDSVVKARKNMDGEFVGKNKVKLGFGKSMATNCVWLDNLPHNTSESFLYKLFNNRFGSVSRVTFEKAFPKALVHFHNMDCAQKAVVDVKSGRLHISGRKLKVDFASRECQELFYDQIQRTVPNFTDRSRETSPTGSYTRFLNRETTTSEFRGSGSTSGQFEGRRGSRSNSYFGSNSRSGSLEEGGHFSTTYSGSGNGNGTGSTAGTFFNKQGSFPDDYNSGSGSYDPDDSYEKELRDYGHHQRERHEQQYKDGTPKRSSKDRSFDRSRKRRSVSVDSRDLHSSDNSLQDYRSRSNSPEFCDSKRAPRSTVSVQRKSRSRSLSPIGSIINKKKYQLDSIERSVIDSDSAISKRGIYRKKDKDFEDSVFNDKYRKKSGLQSVLDSKYKDLKPEKLRTGRLKDAIEETVRANMKRKEYEEIRSKRVQEMLKNDSIESSLLNEGGYDSDRSLKKLDNENQLKRRKLDSDKNNDTKLLKKDDTRINRLVNHSDRIVEEKTFKDNENALRTNIISMNIAKSAVNRPTSGDHNIPIKIKSVLYDKRLVTEKYRLQNTKREEILSEKPNKKELVNKFMRSLRTDDVDPVEMGLEDIDIVKEDNNIMKQRNILIDEKLKHVDKHYKSSKTESKSPREKHSKTTKFPFEDKVMLTHLLEFGESNGSGSDPECPCSDDEHFIKRDLFDQSRSSTRKISLKSSNIPDHNKPAIDNSLSYRKQMEQLRQQQNKDDGSSENKLSVNTEQTNSGPLKDNNTVDDIVWTLIRLSPVEHMKKKPRRISDNAFYQPNEESFHKRSYRPRRSSEDEEPESKPTDIPVSVKVDVVKSDNGRPVDPRLEPREQRLPVRREIQLTPKGTTIPLSVTVPEIESPTALTPISPIADQNSQQALADKGHRPGNEPVSNVTAHMKPVETDSEMSTGLNYDKGINDSNMANLQGRVTPVHDEPLILPAVSSQDIQRDQMRRTHQFATEFHHNTSHTAQKESLCSPLSITGLTDSIHSAHAKFGFSRIPDVQDKTMDNAFLQPTSFEAKLSTFTLPNSLRTSVPSLSGENKTEPLSTRMMAEKGYRIRKKSAVPSTEVSTSVVTTTTAISIMSTTTVTNSTPTEIAKTSTIETTPVKEDGEARGRRISIFDQDSARLAHSTQRFNRRPSLPVGEKSPTGFYTGLDPLGRRIHHQNVSYNPKGLLPHASSNLTSSVYSVTSSVPLQRDSLPNNLHDPRPLKGTINNYNMVQSKEKPVILSDSQTEDSNVLSGKPVAPYTPVKVHTVEERPQLKDHRDFVRISAAVPNQKSETAEPTPSATSFDSVLPKPTKEMETPQIKQEPASDDVFKKSLSNIPNVVKEEIKKEITTSCISGPSLPGKEENELPSPKEIKPDTTMAKLPNESAQSPPVVTTSPESVPLKSILKKDKTDYSVPSGPVSSKSTDSKTDPPPEVPVKKPKDQSLKRKRSPSPIGKAANSNSKASLSMKTQSKISTTGKPVAKKSNKITNPDSKIDKPIGSVKKSGVKINKDKSSITTKEQSKLSTIGKDKSNTVAKDLSSKQFSKESKPSIKESTKATNMKDVKDNNKNVSTAKEGTKTTVSNKDTSKTLTKDSIKQSAKDTGKSSTVTKESNNKSNNTNKTLKEKKSVSETETKVAKHNKDASKEYVTKQEKKELSSVSLDKKKDDAKKPEIKEKDNKTKLAPSKGKKKDIKEKIKKEKVEDPDEKPHLEKETKPVKKKVEEEVKLTKALKHLSGKSKKPGDRKVKDEFKKEEGKVKHQESKVKEDTKVKVECKVKEERNIKDDLKSKKIKNSTNKVIKPKEKKPPVPEVKKKILQVSDIYSDSDDSDSDSEIRDILTPKTKREGRTVIYDSSDSDEEIPPVQEPPPKKTKVVKKKQVKDKEYLLDVKPKGVKSKEIQEKDNKKEPQKKKKVDLEMTSEKPIKNTFRNKDDAKESKKKDEKKKSKQEKESVVHQLLEEKEVKDDSDKEKVVTENIDDHLSDIDTGVSENETNLKSKKLDKEKTKKKVKKAKKDKIITEPIDNKHSKKSKKLKKKSTPTEESKPVELNEQEPIAEEIPNKRDFISDVEANEFEDSDRLIMSIDDENESNLKIDEELIDKIECPKTPNVSLSEPEPLKDDEEQQVEEQPVKEKKKQKKKEKKKLKLEETECKDFDIDESLEDLKPLSIDDELNIAEDLPHGEHIIQEEEHHDPLEDERIELKEEEQLFQSDEKPFDDKDRLFIETDEKPELPDSGLYAECDLKGTGDLTIVEETTPKSEPNNVYSNFESIEAQDTKTSVTEPVIKSAQETDSEPAREDAVRGKSKPKKKSKSGRKPKKSQAEKKAVEAASEQPCQEELPAVLEIQQPNLFEEESNTKENVDNVVAESSSAISTDVNSVELATRLIENFPDTIQTIQEPSSVDTSGMVDSKLKENETLAAKEEAKEEVLDAVKWMEIEMDYQEPSFTAPSETQDASEIIPIEQSIEAKPERVEPPIVEELPEPVNVPIKVDVPEEKPKKRTRGKGGRGSKSKPTIMELMQEKPIAIIENPLIAAPAGISVDALPTPGSLPPPAEPATENKHVAVDTSLQDTHDNNLTIDTEVKETKPNVRSSARRSIDPYDFNEEDTSYQRKGRQGKYNNSKKQTEAAIDSEPKLTETVNSENKVPEDPYEFKGSPAEEKEKSSPSKATRKPKTPTRRPTGRASRSRSASLKGKDLKAKDELLAEPLSEPLPASPKPDTVAKLLQREANQNAISFDSGKKLSSLPSGARVPMVSNPAVPYILNPSLAASMAPTIPTTLSQGLVPGPTQAITSQIPTIQLTSSAVPAPQVTIPSKTNTQENLLTAQLISAPIVTPVPTQPAMVCPVLPGNISFQNSKSQEMGTNIALTPAQQGPPPKKTRGRQRKKDETAQKLIQQHQQQQLLQQQLHHLQQQQQQQQQQEQQTQDSLPTKAETMQHQPQIALTRPPVQLGIPLQVHVPQHPQQTIKPTHLSPAPGVVEPAEKVGFVTEQPRIYQTGLANLTAQLQSFSVPTSVTATTYAAASVLRERLMLTTSAANPTKGRENTKVVTSQMQYVPGYALSTSASDVRAKNEAHHGVIQANNDYVSQERKEPHQVAPPGRAPHPNVHVVGGPLYYIPPTDSVSIRPLTPGFPQQMVPPGIFPYRLYTGVEHLPLSSPVGNIPSPRMPIPPVSSPGLSPKIISPNSQLTHKRGTPPVSLTEKKDDDPTNKAGHITVPGMPLTRIGAIGYSPRIHHMPPVITEPHLSTPKVTEQQVMLNTTDMYKIPAGYHPGEGHPNDPHSQARRIPPPGMDSTGPHPVHNRIPPPPASSPMQRKQDHLGNIILRYPIMWQGVLALKNETAFIQMHYVSGNMDVAGQALNQTMSMEEGSPPLRVAQRMRLEQSQLDGVGRRMKVESECCILIALPCGRDHQDVMSQTGALNTGFITYLQQKQAAGIINVPHPGSNQPAFVVHIFPPCEFTQVHLAHVAPDFFRDIADLAHLMIVIATT
ncbi:uncharacterized protein [Antedon mediterranea]|uniref:uncharacterized protein n=1 Tax=Antedon mediterranea TaxID=105859 RepID=UPI003AF8F97D